MTRNIEKLNACVREYQAIRALVSEAKAEQDALAGVIKSLLEEAGLDEYTAATGHC